MRADYRSERGGWSASAEWFLGRGLRPLIFLVALSIVVLFSPGKGCADGRLDTLSGAVVEKIVDGDTLEVSYKGETLRVRLWGIDTPEWEQGFSRKAKDFTRRMVSGKQVVLQAKTWDKYGRLVAVVWQGNEIVNEELVKEGLAWVHVFFCHEPICDQWRQLEKLARANRRGLWQEQDPVPPWEWKRQQR